MKLPIQSNRLLRVEMLESRTLLAGTGFEAALAEVTPAVSGQGDFTFGFSERIGQSELFVTGSNTSSLTINFDLLPAFVTAVSVANFETVTFTGNDQLSKLVVTDVKTFDADNIAMSGSGLAYATNVGTLSLAAGGFQFVLGGTSTKLDVANLDNTLILSNLGTLSITSQTPKLSIVSLNSAQTLKLLYNADAPSLSGFEKQAIILPEGEVATVDNGSNTGTNPVVTTPLDEQTSLLLARLREALLSGNTASVFAVLDSLAGSANTLGTGTLGVAAHVAAQAGHGTISIETAEPPKTFASSAPFASSMPTLGELETSGQLLAPAAPVLNDAATLADRPADFAEPADVQTLVSALDGEEAETVFAGALFRDQAQQLFMEKLHEESRALKDIVLDGIAAEITPGEQTAYLLVDPKPSRANADRNRESSLDLYV